MLKRLSCCFRPSSRVRNRFDRRGATVVELAMAAPLFFLIVFALVEFSRLAMAQHAIAGVAREGARRAALAVTSDSSEVATWMRQQLQPVIPDATNSQVVQVSVQPNSLQSIPSGTAVSTSVSVEFSAISWLPPTFLGDLTLQATATVQRE